MDPRVRQTINLISEDLSRPFNFDALAVSVNLSPSRLRHLFKSEIGLTPAQYLKRLRIEGAVAGNSGPPRGGTITIDVGGISWATIQISQQGVPTLSFYRYWNAGIYNHYYTTDFGELGNGANGYVFERVEGHVDGSQVSGTVPLKRYYCADNGDHFYTTNPNEPGSGLPCYQFEKVAAYVFPNQVSGTVPLYRYYEPNAQDHFYTTNFNELGNGNYGWYLEGVQCFVFP